MQLVNINVVSRPTLEPPALLPRVSFEDRFERDGRWIMGRSILGAIVSAAREKPIIASINPHDRTQLYITVPARPMVRNEIDGKFVDIYLTIPWELRPIFDDCCLEAMSYRESDVSIVTSEVINRQATPHAVNIANAMFEDFERERRARADRADPEFWHILADRFGADWWNLPSQPFA